MIKIENYFHKILETVGRKVPDRAGIYLRKFRTLFAESGAPHRQWGRAAAGTIAIWDYYSVLLHSTP